MNKRIKKYLIIIGVFCIIGNIPCCYYNQVKQKERRRMLIAIDKAEVIARRAANYFEENHSLPDSFWQLVKDPDKEALACGLISVENDRSVLIPMGIEFYMERTNSKEMSLHVIDMKRSPFVELCRIIIRQTGERNVEIYKTRKRDL